jgi:mono/diheme cytochrome c family protein
LNRQSAKDAKKCKVKIKSFNAKAQRRKEAQRIVYKAVYFPWGNVVKQMSITRIVMRLAFATCCLIIPLVIVAKTVEIEKGNTEAGRQVYTTRFYCSGCHDQGLVAPATSIMFDLAARVRLSDPTLADMTTEQYLAESIIRPSAYIAPPFSDIMPKTYHQGRLSIQQIEDIIAYLEARSRQRRSVEAAKIILQTTLQDWITSLCAC